MKIGILSDVHSNLEALEAVLDELRGRGVERFVCCGDVVGYGPDPNRCTEIVRALKGVCVAGNHDFGTLDREPASEFNPAAAEALAWTRTQLSHSNRTFLENLQLAEKQEPLTVVHASISAPDQWEYVFTVREAEDEMDFYSDGACVVGHSHHPFAVERPPGGPAHLIRHESFEFHPDAKYFINVGSVGQPRDGDPRACCLLFDTRASTMTYLRVSYDIAATQRKMRAAGLPESLAARLAFGH